MHILIVEDDKDLCSILKKELKKENFLCDICNNGNDAMSYILNKVYDIIILDRMLPEKDGLTILKEIRKNNISCPVIMITAMNTIENRIEGLDNGADDYLVKPFAIEELYARIKAVARRPSNIVNNTLLTFSDIKLDMDKTSLSANSKTCTLSKREADLLAFFIKNKNNVLTREMILTRVWGADSFVTDSNLDNFIFFLRKRLKTVDSIVKIKTIHGIGYKLL